MSALRLNRRYISLLAMVIGMLCASSLPANAADAESIATQTSSFATVRTSRYLPLTPCRLVDTRGETRNRMVSIPVSGQCGVPVQATAVIVTLTATGVNAFGFLTAWPSGVEEPTASNLNFGPGQTLANTALVSLGLNGAISISSSVTADKIVDVTGYFVPASSAQAGRYVEITPSRLMDSRNETRPAAGSTTTVTATGLPDDVSGIAVNITFTNASNAGYFTVYGQGARPTASSGNVDRVGQTRAIFTIVPTSADIHIYSQSGADIIVDVVGYFTGESAQDSTEGLLSPQAPSRVLDTRSTGPIYANGSMEIAVPSGSAVWANVTAVDSTAAGFLSARAAGTSLNATSAVNFDRGADVANSAIISRSERGIALWSRTTSHAIVDIMGVFSGPSQASPEITSRNARPACSAPGAVVEIDRDGQHGYFCNAIDGSVIDDFPVTTRDDQPGPGEYPMMDRTVSSFADYPDENTTSGAGTYNLPYFIGFTYGSHGIEIGLHAIPRLADGTLLQPVESLGTPDASGGRFSLGCIHLPDEIAARIFHETVNGDIIRILN